MWTLSSHVYTMCVGGLDQRQLAFWKQGHYVMPHLLLA